MTIRRCSPAGSRLLETPDGPAVLTCAPLGAEEIRFSPLRDAPTRRDMETTLDLAGQCRAPTLVITRTLRP